MKIKPIAANQTVLDRGFAQIFFSYETPVAAILPSGSIIRSNVKYSATTTKHINKWLNGAEAQLVPQNTIDNLLTSTSECDGWL